MRHRGLLTEDDRALFSGEKTVDDPQSAKADVRWRVRQRMKNLEDDLELLREANEDDLVREFNEKFGRTAQLEARIDELEARLDE